MKLKRSFGILSAAVMLTARSAGAQIATNDLATARTNAALATLSEADVKEWAYSVSACGYLVPNDRDYVQPTITADRDWLHLEARYNYEALDTGSAWIGYNLSVGDKLTLDVTPMLGGVFGELTGIAPGYEFTLGWWKLELYSEGEYVFDPGDSSGSFFYSWSELSLAPVDWFRCGVVAQRTRAYQTDVDIQRGFLVGVTFKKVDFTTYLFNPDQSKPTLVLAAGVDF